ncbi:MAG: ABC transporter permease [Candidatus Nanopelagicales bacterium]|nr:ABC transporter permease [Candidatus Nanopelagicales bacterium]
MIANLVYEWRRLWSVRATWIMTFVYLVITGLLGAGPLFLGDGEFGTQTWKGLYSTNANFLCLVMLSVVASQFFGHEYRYGTIRLTLTEFPKRERVVLAKTLLLALYVTLATILGWAVLGVVGSIAPEGSIGTNGPGLSINGGEPSELWQVLVFGFAYCLIAMSLTMITRNLALGIVLPLLLSSIIEGLIVLFAGLANGKMDWIVDALPFSNGTAWLTNLPDQPNAGLIFAAWVSGTYLIGSAMFFKRDA